VKHIICGAVLVSVLLCGGVFGAEPLMDQTPETVFLAHFDQGLNADFAVGKKEALMMKNAQLAGEGKGLTGNCVQVGPGGSLAFSATDGNFPVNEGTLELWVKTDAWESTADTKPAGDGQRYHRIFHINGKPWSSLTAVYDDYWNMFNARVSPVTAAGAKEMALGYGTPVKKGEWIYVAVTWKNFNGEKGRQEVSLYINGVLQSSRSDLTVDFAVDANSRISLGCAPDEPASSWNGYIDEVRIQKTCLNMGKLYLTYKKGLAILAGSR